MIAWAVRQICRKFPILVSTRHNLVETTKPNRWSQSIIVGKSDIVTHVPEIAMRLQPNAPRLRSDRNRTCLGLQPDCDPLSPIEAVVSDGCGYSQLIRLDLIETMLISVDKIVSTLYVVVSRLKEV